MQVCVYFDTLPKLTLKNESLQIDLKQTIEFDVKKKE